MSSSERHGRCGPRRSRCSGRVARERGSGTVLASGALAVVVLASVAALVLVAVVRDVRAARVAADLAALAAATPLAAGGAADCTAAADLSMANGARVESCDQLADGSVAVTVTVRRGAAVTWLPLLPESVGARARAGLASPAADPVARRTARPAGRADVVRWVGQGREEVLGGGGGGAESGSAVSRYPEAASSEP
ncbi:MAG: Rv3654c family TadE-like protein [Dermatophilaceae bacterium]